MIILDRSDCRVASYSSASRGGKHTARIDLEVGDPVVLGFILRDLAEATAAQKPKRSRATAPLLLSYSPENS